MVLRGKIKDTEAIINGYDAAIQFLLDNNMHFVQQTCTVFIKASEHDLKKLLKYLYKHHRKFYYYLSKPSNKTHKIENKIFYEEETIYNDGYYYIY